MSAFSLPEEFLPGAASASPFEAASRWFGLNADLAKVSTKAGPFGFSTAGYPGDAGAALIPATALMMAPAAFTGYWRGLFEAMGGNAFTMAGAMPGMAVMEAGTVCKPETAAKPVAKVVPLKKVQPAPGKVAANAPSPAPAPIKPVAKAAKPNGVSLAHTTIEARPQGMPAPRGGKPDDLKMISGVGPKIETILHDLGIFHFDQIAVWTTKEIEWVDDYLKFSGRIIREDWIAQAAALAKGGRDEYVKVFGKEPR